MNEYEVHKLIEAQNPEAKARIWAKIQARLDANTLYKKIHTEYEQAIVSLNQQIAAGPQTAQARYNARKHNRKTQTGPQEKMIHELKREERWALQGALYALDYLLALQGNEEALPLEIIGQLSAERDVITKILYPSEFRS